jgi:hypothetical protein
MDSNKFHFSANGDREGKDLLNLSKVQRLVREQITSDISLVDELIAERREEARRESDRRL